MYLFRFSTQHEPGTYCYTARPDDGAKTAIAICPVCSTPLHLKNHSIDHQGKVFPNGRCTNEDCSFDTAIQLQDWYPYWSEEDHV